jgi:hypothetical protein
MDSPRPDDDRALVLRLVVTPDGGVRVRVIAVSALEGEHVIGFVTSAAAAAALVRGWIDGVVENVSPSDPGPGR